MGQTVVFVTIPYMNEEKTPGNCIERAWKALEHEVLVFIPNKKDNK